MLLDNEVIQAGKINFKYPPPLIKFTKIKDKIEIPVT